MARGFIGGAVSGVIVALSVTVVASVVLPPIPNGPQATDDVAAPPPTDPTVAAQTAEDGATAAEETEGTREGVDAASDSVAPVTDVAKAAADEVTPETNVTPETDVIPETETVAQTVDVTPTGEGAADVVEPAPYVADVAPTGTQTPQAIAALPQTAQQAEAEAPPLAQVPVATAVPQSDAIPALDDRALTPATPPVTGPVTLPQTPATPEQGIDVATSPEEPIFPNPLALAPMTPQAPDGVRVTTRPAEPPTPPVVPNVVGADDPLASDDTLQETVQPAAEVTPPQTTQDAPAVVAQAELQTETPAEAQPDAQTNAQTSAQTDAETEAETQQVSQDIRTAEPAGPPEDQVSRSSQTPAQAPEGETVAEAAEDAAPAQRPQPEADAAPDTSVQTAQNTQTEETAPLRPQIGRPAGALTDRDSGVIIRRPSSAAIATIQEDAPPGETLTDEGAGDPDEDNRPVAKYAQAFENPDQKPLMSIVLIDDGSTPTSGAAGIEALRSFPYSLSFAVDTNLADAQDRMMLYRSEGFEVLAMVDLPQGAQATDAETTMGVVLSQMPQVVAVLEGPGVGLQETRALSDQVTEILVQSGHGLVTQDTGLNTMPNLARKEGVPAEAIFRDFDSKGQTATVIRRFLDQAAFKAGQEGAVIMLGRLRPDTVTALLLWGLQDRAGRVALAPISSVLLREDAQ